VTTFSLWRKRNAAVKTKSKGGLVPQSNPNSATMLLHVGKRLLVGNPVGESALEIIGQSVHVPAPDSFPSSIPLFAPS
jgi:hypothetical protein